VKLASLRSGGRDGRLVIVSRDLARCLAVPGIAPTMQAALDDWDAVAPRLAERAAALEASPALPESMAFAAAACAAPLPRAFHWVDGSAYVNHVELVRKARGAEMPASFWTDPLVYQGGSDDLLGAHDDVPFGDEAWGIDLEAEIAVITDAVPMATGATRRAHIKLVMLVNDWSLRASSRRAREGLRLLPIQPARRSRPWRDARRTRRRLARQQGAPAAREPHQWREFGRPTPAPT
jgi:fumarylacetoacetate (FAA) hydrolase